MSPGQKNDESSRCGDHSAQHPSSSSTGTPFVILFAKRQLLHQSSYSSESLSPNPA